MWSSYTPEMADIDKHRGGSSYSQEEHDIGALS